MADLKPKHGRSKQRQTTAPRADGLKQLRVWVPDPSTREFQLDIQRQMNLLRGAPEEQDAMRFIAAAVAFGR